MDLCNAHTPQLAWCLHEQPYAHLESLDSIFQECLVSVRSAEDVEDEQLDGGIRRQWLSQFEFVKLFTMSPEPRFLSWLTLWYRLPSVEKGVRWMLVSCWFFFFFLFFLEGGGGQLIGLLGKLN